MLRLISDSELEKFALGIFGDWISILGNTLSWETVGELGEELSRRIVQPVGALGYFDDDVLTWRFYQNGQEIKVITAGQNLDEYGLEYTPIDISFITDFFKVLQLTEDDYKSILNTNDEMNLVIEELEELLGIPLWMKYDWVKEDEDLKKFYPVMV